MENEKVTFAPADEEDLPTAVEMANRRFANAKSIEEIKKYRIIPRHEWVLIRRIYDQDALTSGGFLIAANKERSSVGEVVAAGAKSDLKPGDRVIYTNYALDLEGIEQATGEKELQLLRDEEVYARLEQLEQAGDSHQES